MKLRCQMLFLSSVKQEEQKRTWEPGSCRHLWPLYLAAISTSTVSLPVAYVAELSPGAPALYSEAAAHLKKLELETVKTAGPWPALHININKVSGWFRLECTNPAPHPIPPRD